jgi:hypothetical protein
LQGGTDERLPSDRPRLVAGGSRRVPGLSVFGGKTHSRCGHGGRPDA